MFQKTTDTNDAAENKYSANNELDELLIITIKQKEKKKDHCQHGLKKDITA